MNTLLGTIITALVTDENDKFYFVQKDGVTFALSKEEGEHAIGDMVTGFAYTDSKQKSRLTQKKIKATRDSYDWGEVTEVRKDLGVFVDVGIPDKEIVVSLDVLPELKELWPKKGDKLYIKLDVDKKDRIWVADREGDSIQVFTDDGELIAYCSEGLYQPSEIWADDQYIYVGERGGITIFDYDVNVVAQLGFYMSSLMTHGFCGDSKGNLYIMTLSDALPYSLLKLKRL